MAAIEFAGAKGLAIMSKEQRTKSLHSMATYVYQMALIAMEFYVREV
jgi:hypothetical protein